MQNDSARNDRREMPPREMAQREMARTARIISLARKNCALARIKSRARVQKTALIRAVPFEPRKKPR